MWLDMTGVGSLTEPSTRIKSIEWTLPLNGT